MNRSSLGSWLGLAALCWITMAGSASTRADDLANLLEMPLEQLKQVSITGSTLTDQTLQQVPASVSVFTRDDIDAMGIDTLNELMNFVPGFQAARQGEGGNHSGYSSRGRKIGTAGREILVLIDGLRVDNSLNSGSSFTLPMLSLGNIDRVEFIRGPGSAIYGSNAFLGVINIVTVRDANRVGLAAGENQYADVQLLGSTRLGEVQLDAFARYFGDDGDDYTVINTDDRSNPYTLETDDPRSGMELQLTARYRQSTVQLIHADRDTHDFYVFDTVSNGINEMDGNFSVLALEQGIDWHRRLHSDIRIGVSRWRQETAARYPGIVNPGAELPLLFIDIEDDEKWVTWHNDWQLADQGSLQFGLEYRHAELNEATIGSNYNLAYIVNDAPLNAAGEVPLVPLKKREIYGVYLQHQRELIADTELTLGLRYDDYSSVGSSLSPRFGLTHALNASQTLKLLYGEAFRAPSFNELYAKNNPVVAGNDDLDPETVQTWELIWLGQWRPLSLSVAYFDNTFKDSIIEGNYDGLRSFVNADEEDSRGVELEASTQLGENWYLRGTYTHFDKKPDSAFRESDSLASITVNFNAGRWNANLAVYYHGEKEMIQGGQTDSKAALDEFWNSHAKLAYQLPLTCDCTAYLQVKNLFDEDFQTPPQGSYLREGIKNRGREFRVGITLDF